MSNVLNCKRLSNYLWAICGRSNCCDMFKVHTYRMDECNNLIIKYSCLAESLFANSSANCAIVIKSGITNLVNSGAIAVIKTVAYLRGTRAFSITIILKSMIPYFRLCTCCAVSVSCKRLITNRGS